MSLSRSLRRLGLQQIQHRRPTPCVFMMHSRSFSLRQPTAQRIGFIGLGNMGVHMAHNLLKNGHPLVSTHQMQLTRDNARHVSSPSLTRYNPLYLGSRGQTVYDVIPKGVDTLQSHASTIGQAVRVARSPADVALDCRVIITMLPTTPHVLDVYTNEKTGIFSAFPGADTSTDSTATRSSATASRSPRSSLSASSSSTPLFIDSSTIDPATSRHLAEVASTLHCSMIDAPVSGGITGAEQGTLTFMVGASSSAFQSAQPYLSRMGRNIVHCGAAGTGQSAKICNNLALAIQMASVAESCNLAQHLGLDVNKLAAIMNTSTGRCWSSDTYHPVPGVMANVPSSREYAGGFGSALMMKDLRLALEAGRGVGVRVEMGERVLALYERVKEKGWAGKDFSVIYQLMKEETESGRAAAGSNAKN